MKAKLTSRKLWVALAGICTGIGLCVSGSVTEGAATIITSVVGYVLAEGIVDAKAVKNMEQIIKIVSDDIEDTEED